MVPARGTVAIERAFLVFRKRYAIMSSMAEHNDHDEVVRHGIRLDHAEDSITGIRRDFVSKIEHAPVKAIAFGLASIILTSFAVGVVGLILTKAQ